MPLTFTPLSENVGLQVSGLDLSKDIDEPTKQEILDAWVKAGVLLFRDAAADEAAHMRLSHVFGEPELPAFRDLRVETNPFLLRFAYEPDNEAIRKRKSIYIVNGVERAGWLGWHWDQSFMPQIVRGAVFRMIEPSPTDGQTGFIDAIAAYDRLPDALKHRIDKLEVVYSYTGAQEKNRFGYPEVRIPDGRDVTGTPSDPNRHKFPPSVHPLVITQMETGRKVLKLSPMNAQSILGMEPEESDALLHRLADHLVDDRFAYYHEYEKNDMIVWDNWRMIHSARGCPLDETRIAERTTIVGDYGHGRYLDETLDRDRVFGRIND